MTQVVRLTESAKLAYYASSRDYVRDRVRYALTGIVKEIQPGFIHPEFYVDFSLSNGGHLRMWVNESECELIAPACERCGGKGTVRSAQGYGSVRSCDNCEGYGYRKEEK